MLEKKRKKKWEKRSKRNPKRWKNKSSMRVHRKVLKKLTRNFTKSFLHLMFKDPEIIKRWTIIPRITKIAEFPRNQSSLNYLARLPLHSQSILPLQVHVRISLIPMSSRFRQQTFYRR